MTHQRPVNRRDALRLVAVTAGGGMLMTQGAFAQQLENSARQTQALLFGADVCVITPEVTEGPYYFDPDMERTDLAEGRPGVPITVRLQVVDATCTPIPEARVDLWHCDATGLYSGYPGQGADGSIDTTSQTFMRGTQFADQSGVVEFETVYPGWYRGRTTHVHFKVFLDQTNVLTGQIFFPDALSEYIYLNVAPYTDRGSERDTLNSDDGIATQASRASYAFVKELDEAYLVAMIIGVDPVAESGGSTMGGLNRGAPPDGRPPGAGAPRSERTAADRANLVPGAT